MSKGLKQKHILIAIHRFIVGGAETQAKYLAAFLIDNGFKVAVGAFGFEEGEGFERFKKCSIPTYRWGFQEKLILDSPIGWIGKLRKIRFLIQLSIQVKILSPDVVISFTYPSNMIFGRWYKLMGVNKCIWNQRDLGIGHIFYDKEKVVLNQVSEIVANSNSGASFLNGITSRKVTVIPNGIHVHELSYIQESEVASLRVVMVANFSRNKDHITLLKAWKIILETLPDRSLNLALVGKRRDSFSDLASFLKFESLENVVELIEDVEDVTGFLRQFHVGVLSSHQEGMSNSIMEYMSVGLPVIASDIPSNRELLGENYPFLFKPGSPESLSEKLMAIISEENLRTKTGVENRQRVISNFTIDQMGKKYLEIIEG